MRILFFLFLLLPLSCSQRYQALAGLQAALGEVDVPFEQRFLGFSPDMQTFQQKDSTLLQDTLPRIVFTGSSSIRLWKTLETDMANLPYQVVNRGFGGSILPEVNYFFDELITPHQPEIVVLYCGENDIHDGRTSDDVYQSFRTFLQLLFQKSPQTKLLFLGLKPSPARWESWPEFKAANHKIKRLIRQLNSSDIRYLDVGDLMLRGIPKAPIADIFIEDNLHMNTAGYERWTVAVREVLEEMTVSLP